MQYWRRGRRDLQPVSVALDERPAAHMSLNQSLRFQFGVGVGHRGAMHAQHGSELPACRNAVAWAQITGMHQGAQLVAKLHI